MDKPTLNICNIVCKSTITKLATFLGYVRQILRIQNAYLISEVLRKRIMVIIIII
jgi:hypothetical protein